jgi:hypothetical protein
MRTTETFKTPELTYRTKMCRGCAWTFTSHEALADIVTIPSAVRNCKHKRQLANTTNESDT